MRKIKNILYKTLDMALRDDIIDLDQREKTARAFTTALFSDRMKVIEINDYIYIGKSCEKDVFMNRQTGLYLD